jgi:hypothetical protein
MEVSDAARTFQSIALEIGRIAARLRASVSGEDDWRGAAATSARVRSATLPPKLDKADASYAAAGSALGVYARSLSDAQQQSAAAIGSANRAASDLSAAQSAQAAAARADEVAAGIARAASLPPPLPTASRYQAAIDEAGQQLRRGRAANEQAHEQQRNAARTAGAALGQASHEGIHNESWMHHFTHAVGHWASTQWAGALRELSKVASVVSVLAGLGALVLSVAGIFFPPLEAAAAVLETISVVSSFIAASADTVLAATGKGSWTAVGFDALTLLPMGLAKVVTKAAPAIREGRFLRPSSVAHASTGGAAGIGRHASTMELVTKDAWSDPATLVDHFERHGNDIGALSPNDYATRASAFFQRSQQQRLPTKISPNGTIRVFDPNTQLFGSYASDGKAFTVFRPTSPTYWERQPGTLVGGATQNGLQVPGVWLPRAR